MSRTTKRDDPPPEAEVYIVDDDDGMRRGLAFLLRSAGYDVACFASARAFLDEYDPTKRGCLLLDVRMPGMSGLELQEHLRAQQTDLPVIIVTAFADVAMAVRAMKAGAFDFIEKPFEGSALLSRVRRALEREAETRVHAQRAEEARRRLATLTPREREVMDLVVDGLLNKQVAGELGISMKTVENHRARVMEKMGVVSLADLVRLSILAGGDQRQSPD